MSSVAAFFVFLLIMLALATLAIILDWMGKPIRRSFRPRTSGTPPWLMVDAPMVAPDPVASAVGGPDGHSGGAPAELLGHQPVETPAGDPAVSSPGLPAGDPAVSSPGLPAGDPAVSSPGLPAGDPAVSSPGGYPALDPVARSGDSSLPGPWQAGDSIFRLTPRGTPPSITAVRRRYWKNLSERRASVVFGEANRELMAIGQAPQRFNPRTGSIEELSLPEPMLRHCWTTNRRPTPTWGDEGLDPFAGP